jgi:hypothetical protein
VLDSRKNFLDEDYRWWEEEKTKHWRGPHGPGWWLCHWSSCGTQGIVLLLLSLSFSIGMLGDNCMLGM